MKLTHAIEHLQKLIIAQTLAYERLVVESVKHNPWKYWSYVNSKLSNNNKNISAIKTSDGTIEEPTSIAEAFSDFFYQCFNHDSRNISPSNLRSASSESYRPTHTVNKLCQISFDYRDVKCIIKSLPNKRSEDHNGFSYAILKDCADILSYQLSRLFHLSFTTGQLPSDWKRGVILPIKKKTSAISVADYRPISITSCICRVFERLLRNRIESFLEENELISKSQHGFVKGRSTTTALLTYSNDISQSIDNGLCVDVAYFDFSKAFDSVRHDYLIEKLHKSGIQGPILTWIWNYIRNRVQVVNVNGYMSSERSVSSGVIQGSVLGPILFIIFVNDIDECIRSCSILKYADDIRIYRSFDSDIHSQQESGALFQNDINTLVQWVTK